MSESLFLNRCPECQEIIKKETMYVDKACDCGKYVWKATRPVRDEPSLPGIR